MASTKALKKDPYPFGSPETLTGAHMNPFPETRDHPKPRSTLGRLYNCL